MRQFFLETDPEQLPAPGDTVTLDREESHHLFTVLRGGREAELELIDGRGHRLTGLSRGKNGKLAVVEILTLEKDPEEFREPRLVIACAVVKGRRFEWALEKAVELGAHEIVPLVTDQSVVDPRQGKRDRWQTIMTAALKQSGRSWLPTLAETMKVGEALKLRPGAPIYFGAAPDDAGSVENPLTFATELQGEVSGDVPQTLTAMIGPEGGWSSAEIALMSSHGARPVDLGPHVLRTETAAAAATVFLQALRGRWLRG